MSSNFGKSIRISIFGQSHSEGIGVTMDGLPWGKELDMEKIKSFMARRAPGNNSYSTPRKEKDEFKILSGIMEGKTCGAPLCAIIENTNVASKDYDDLKNTPRPGHSDYSATVKYEGTNDYRGGGHFSGRLTAPLCFAGAVSKQFLEDKGIKIGAYVVSIGNVKNNNSGLLSLDETMEKEFPGTDEETAEKMKEEILKAKEEGDSVGGIIECLIEGMPAGVGEPIFEGVENHIAAAIFAIPGVKGIEFGAGFEAARMMGSQNNDEFIYKTEEIGKKIVTATNNHGGILGGISSGMTIRFRVAFKPTPSISKEQGTVDLKNGEEIRINIKGRHDPCIVPRAIPCVEAASAVAILDLMKMGGHL